MNRSAAGRPAIPSPASFAGCVVTIVGVGIADALTGIEISLEILYVGPVYWAAWRSGFGPGLVLSAFAAATWLVADVAAGHRYSEEGVVYWNALVGFLVFSAITAVTARARRLLAEREEARRALERQARELERSNADLEQYAAVAAHDLKSPLLAIGGYVRLLRRRPSIDADAEAGEYLEESAKGVERMESLIEGLLAYARAGAGEENREETDAGSAFDLALANLSAELASTRSSVTRGDLPRVAIDRRALTQLFQNLVGNALKFRGDRPAQVHVGAEKGPAEWVFSVSDRGIGIDPVDRERIFRIFERAHPDPSCPGTGIGLAICRKIVESRGGKIWVESEPGRGATFRFTIPRA